MITHKEIKNLEIEWGIREDIIEKDYVIGWILWGIGSDPYFSEKWVFKGGTCLKKCYIETWRFSEDLDFTLVPPDSPIDTDEIEENLKKLLERLYDESGIDFSVQELALRSSGDPYYLEVRIYYRGPRNAPNPGRIKLDLKSSEKIITRSLFQKINHPYSDILPSPYHVKCYSFEEVFAEKIRAMGERSRPRDLYDIINLFRRKFQHEKSENIKDLLATKCQTKNTAIPTFESITNHPVRAELISEWENMLGHQLPKLPPFNSFWDELPKLFDWLEGRYIFKRVPYFSFRGDEDRRWTAPPTVQRWGFRFPLEKIRYAAANQLCVELGYKNAKRIIEPYSLRRTKEGNLLLHSITKNTGEHRAYRVDRIQSAEITDISFTPKYEIELTTSGPLQVLPAKKTPVRLSRRSPKSKRFSYQSRSIPKYIYECPICTKKFKRKKYDSKLRAHKDKNGIPCPGRTAIFLGREY